MPACYSGIYCRDDLANGLLNSYSSCEIQEKTKDKEDISITFHKQDDFGYIGRDSDIRSLDVEKAISDMRKGQILQQYQYFVGSKMVFTE